MTRGFKVGLFAVLLLAVAGTPAVRAQEDSPLAVRAKAVLKSFGEARTKEAMELVRDALLAMADTLDNAGEYVLETECLERAGIVWYRFGKYDQCQVVWERGLEVARRSENPKRIAALLNATAAGVSAGGDDEKALVLFGELIAVRRSMGDARGEGVSWHNMAYSYVALYRTPEAIDALTQASRLHAEAQNTHGLAVSQNMLAGTLFEMGQFVEALVTADSAVAASERTKDPLFLGLTLGGRARQLHYAGRLEESDGDFARAHEVLSAAGATKHVAVVEVNRADLLVTMERYDEAIELVDGALPALEESGTPAEIVAAQTIRAVAFVQSGRVDEGSAFLEQTIDRFTALRDSLPTETGRAEALRLGGTAYTVLAAVHARAGRHEEAWAVIENATAFALREKLGVGKVGPEELRRFQQHLSDIDAIAIQFGSIATNINVACVVTPSNVHAVELKIPAGTIRDMGSVMALMAAGASDAQCAPVLTRLGETILEPLAPYLSESAERLIVIPGGFAGLSFEALPGGGVAIDLGERYPITYAPSALVFVSLDARDTVTSGFLAFADPSSELPPTDQAVVAMRSARLSRVPLLESRAEARRIAPSTDDILFGSDATKQAFFERGPDAAVIHFATHAVIDATHPEYSALVLAGKDEDAVTLSAADIQRGALQADLVSLSGCSTAGGYVVTGEGTFGLTRAFLVAGARSVVSSWWDVEDGAARRFMELFYDALRDGVARDIAVQTARRTMAGEGYTHRDRSAFVLTGATAQPVATVVGSARPGSRSNLVFLMAGLAMLLIVIAIARRRRTSDQKP